MTEPRGRDLEQWMIVAAASGEPALKSFVTGLRADQDAVTAGLTLRWSSGSVEGYINRPMMLRIWPAQKVRSPASLTIVEIYC
jgi:transposase